MSVEDLFITRAGVNAIRRYLQNALTPVGGATRDVPLVHSAYERNAVKLLFTHTVDDLSRQIDDLLAEGSISYSYFAAVITAVIEANIKMLTKQFDRIKVQVPGTIEERSRRFNNNLVEYGGKFETFLHVQSRKIFTEYNISAENIYKPEKPIKGLYYNSFKRLLEELYSSLQESDPAVGRILHKLRNRLDKHENYMDINDIRLFLKSQALHEGLENTEAACVHINQLLGECLLTENGVLYAGRVSGMEQLRLNTQGDIAHLVMLKQLPSDGTDLDSKYHMQAAQREHSAGLGAPGVPVDRWVHARAQKMVAEIQETVLAMTADFFKQGRTKCQLRDCLEYAEEMIHKHIDSPVKHAAARLLPEIFRKSFENALENPARHLKDSRSAGRSEDDNHRNNHWRA